ncbi:transposase [Dulcicalothrix desertica PCC 7102]|uniref:Transposase n=1 Tax=Dulcicalothrix desertica PCC 7102 TaxID=232991 RepID=A0A3S1AHF9_9CYAN|nr:RNA-guided endonuclease TnpB family protein [Dulcicalothrix desertica]RUT00556.1 transposase [Dulcicalothrix desertica PCC 7102]TWH53300.1 putative transposase [Dulcicalothrix desertica PCC 7102]
MQLVERRVIKSNHQVFSQVDEMCFASKNLYNKATFIMRQSFLAWGQSNVPQYNSLYHMMKDFEEYKALPAKVSQQVLKMVAQNWTSFFAASLEYQIEPSKFTGRPSLPRYLDKDGRYCVIFTSQATSKKQLGQELIKLSEIDYSFETCVKLGNVNKYCQSRIIPKLDHYVLEIVYEVSNVKVLDNDKIAAIDFGVNNLMAITSNVPGFEPVLINGRPLKSINQFYNSKRATITSKNSNKSSKRLKRFTTSRNHLVKDYLHRASTYVINLLSELGISKLVLGKNKGWKNGINIGGINNQNFVQIPHAQLIDMLTYKGAMKGIQVIIQEESYTSSSSFLDSDFIPVYGNKPLNWKPSGKRVKRGLYVTSNGIALNADINGSYKILVKAFPNAFSFGDTSVNGIGNREVLVTPRKVNLEGHAPLMVIPF